MAISAAYREYLEDLFAPVGGVTQRRMFGLELDSEPIFVDVADALHHR